MLNGLFRFERWLRQQPKARQEEIEDQLDREGTLVWVEETQTYIVVFAEADETDQQNG